MKRILTFPLLLSALLGLVAAGLPVASTWYQELTKEQQAGKSIYTRGIGSSNVKVMANMSGVDVPATIMTCVNCHNARGTGNPEGGIVPSNITWLELTKSYGGKRQDGSSRPPYTERSLRKVITTGIDPAGNPLHSTMPKYNMTRADMDNLIAYLKVLGTDITTGVTDRAISLAVVLPENTSTTTGKNQAIIKLVDAYCKELNEQGGIYTRTLIPQFFSPSDTFNPENYFMVIGFGNKTLEKTVNAKRIPSLFTISVDNSLNGLNNPYVFYTYPSLTAQSLSLVDFSESLPIQHKKSQATIVFYEDGTSPYIAHQIANYYRARFGIQPTLLNLQQQNAITLAKSKKIASNDLLFFVGPQPMGNQLIQALAKQNKFPFVLVPGSIAGIDLYDLPFSFQEKVYIGYPTWITDQTLQGRNLYSKLMDDHSLDHHWKRSQLDILSMLLTAEECLKRSGRNLDREDLKETLEGLLDYSNGLGPRISYSRNKRVGNSNMYIVGFNSEEKKVQPMAIIQSKEN